MIPFRRRIRQWWRIIFPPRALRIPGKWPWVRPSPTPYGTILIDDPVWPIYADGKGGIITGDPTKDSFFRYPPQRRGKSRIKGFPVGY